MIRLETERLLLRLPEERDLDALARMHADEAHMRYMGGALDREGTWRQIAWMLGHWQIRGHGLFAVEDRSDGTFLGRVGFIHPEGWPGFEIGWLIGPGYAGRGYATEAATAPWTGASTTWKRTTSSASSIRTTGRRSAWRRSSANAPGARRG